MNYLLLQHPGHNRVYYNVADKLALAELKIACSRLKVTCSEIKISEIKGVRYLAFSTTEYLGTEDLNLLSKLSFIFALFQLEEINGKTFLSPIQKISYEYLDPKISTLLKYQGKTNELFTKMMLNVALLSGDFNYSDNITLLDPVAGKGTTLFEAAVYGMNSYGIEVESKLVHETGIFFKKFLERERMKHLFSKKQVSGSGKANAVNMLFFEYAKSKQEFKTPDTIKTLGLVTGNSKNAFNYFKNEKFHLIVGDLPYGIVHGNKGKNSSSSVTRNPSELLDECLPQWYKVLKKGGTIVLAWNSFLVSRVKLSEKFVQHQFDVLTQSPYDEFEHMVDKSIKRDIIVAKKN